MENFERTPELDVFLQRFLQDEQNSWFNEIVRLAQIVLKYQTLGKKWRYDNLLKKYIPTKEVFALCKEAACTNITIIAREPSRARPPSPYTLNRWSKNFNTIGLRTFLRCLSTADPQKDKRRISVTINAIDWINKNWRRYKGARAFYRALEKEANNKSWKIPSESWIYRRWQEIPKIVSTLLFEGQDKYRSKFGAYLPRDLHDLQALQVLCGDHREGDVTVHLGNGKLARLWLTYWLDLRTSLIWGWYLSITPNSEAIALAYDHGISQFGAQPFSRPEDDFYSYIYTDRGKSYRSHDIEGKEIKVHERASDVSGGFSYFLTERNIGLVEDFRIQQLLAKPRNPKEKPIERTNRDFSTWEKEEVVGYCGSKPSERPDAWYKLFEEHNKLSSHELHKAPVISVEDYKFKIAERVTEHNNSIHLRTNLCGKSIVPIDEYNSLYTTHYKVSESLVATLLQKNAVRTIGKIGIRCFRKNWFYYHEELSEFKGKKVQIKYTDQDYKKIWVILPDRKCVRADLIEPSPFLELNKETLKKIKQIEINDKQVFTNFQLVNQSNMRFESPENRVAKNNDIQSKHLKIEDANNQTSASIHLFPKIAASKFQDTKKSNLASITDIEKAESSIEVLSEIKIRRVNEFD